MFDGNYHHEKTRDVYLHCCKNGWIALVGSDKTSFSEIIGQQKIQRPFSRIANGDPFSGKATGSRYYRDWETDRKSTRLNSSHSRASRMPSSA